MKRVLVGVVCALAACGPLRAAPAKTAEKSTREQAEELAMAQAVRSASITKQDYHLSAADLLQITVFGVKDMDTQARVGQTGTISFPLVGDLKVGGMTVPEASAALAGKLKDYVRNPQVTIFIKEYGNKKVFVFGQVMKPGAVELPTETKLTVLEAISQSQGFTRIAAPDRTRVVRLVDGKNQTFVIEVSAITKRGEKDKDMTLEPNDIVFVPESIF
jgi:polysaccharide export outer membrane protein